MYFNIYIRMIYQNTYTMLLPAEYESRSIFIIITCQRLMKIQIEQYF